MTRHFRTCTWPRPGLCLRARVRLCVCPQLAPCPGAMWRARLPTQAPSLLLWSLQPQPWDAGWHPRSSDFLLQGDGGETWGCSGRGDARPGVGPFTVEDTSMPQGWVLLHLLHI